MLDDKLLSISGWSWRYIDGVEQKTSVDILFLRRAPCGANMSRGHNMCIDAIRYTATFGARRGCPMFHRIDHHPHKTLRTPLFIMHMLRNLWQQEPQSN